MKKSFLCVLFFITFFLFYSCFGASFRIGRDLYQLRDGVWQTATGQVLTAGVFQNGLHGILDGNTDMAGDNRDVAPVPENDRTRAVMLTISRLLLAQGNAADAIVDNNIWGYVTPEVSVRLPAVLDPLLNHWLTHGHLGFFPMMSTPRHESGFANLPLSRGIFNITNDVMNRVNNNQRAILADYNAFVSGKVSVFVPVSPLCYSILGPAVLPPIGLHNFHLLPNIMQNIGYDHLDPDIGVPLSLRQAASNLLIALFTTGSITNIVIGDTNNRRFTLDITYEFHDPIPNATQTQDVGYDLASNTTNRVFLVLQVVQGVISVVTMYPH